VAQAKPLQLAEAGSELAKKTEEQELRSVQLLLNLLDKTFRTARTYGLRHQLVQKFVEQLYDELIAHINGCGTLPLLVRRFEFYYQGKVVYQKPSPTENLAFMLYAEGVRELSFAQGLSRDDLIQFLLTGTPPERMTRTPSLACGPKTCRLCPLSQPNKS